MSAQPMRTCVLKPAAALWGAAILGCIALAGLGAGPSRALAQAAYTTYSTYDNAHRLLGTIGMSAQSAYPATRYTYDSYSRPVLIEEGYIASWQGPPTLPSNWTGFTVVTSTAIAYDAYGRKIQTQASSGGTPLSLSQTTYDAESRVSCEAVRMNVASPPAVGSSACTLGSTGADGPDRITQYNYDSLNRVTSQLQAVGTAQAQTYASYGYGGDSEQTSLTDANGNLTTSIYDGFDRLSQVQYPTPSNGAVSNTADSDSYSYDANSNLVSHTLRDGNVMSISYDALNRDVAESVAGANPVYTTYDLLNRPIGYGPSASQTTEAITYDNAGRITTETTNTYPMSYAYDADGDRTQITYFDGRYITYAYNAADQLTTVQAPQATSSPTLLGSYSYDAMGRRIGLTRGSGTTTAYAYDGLSRLSTLGHTMPSTYAQWNQTYGLGYAASSQLNQINASNSAYTFAPPAQNVSATANGLNQLATSGGSTLSYDARGNLTFDGVNTYAYDTLNQLSTVNGATTLSYDSRHRLLSVTPSGGAATQFVYAGDQLAVEFQVSGATATILDRYVPVPGEDRPIAMYNSSNFTYQYELLEDHAGSIVAVNGGDGDNLHVNRYDDYGVPGPNNWGRYQYTGQVWLSEVGLYDYKARMYSPSLGRFLQTDPIGYGDGPNWYQYVGGDPVNETDPSGMDGDNTVSGITVNGQSNNGGGSLGGGGVSVGGGTAPEPGSGQSSDTVQQVVVTAKRLHNLIITVGQLPTPHIVCCARLTIKIQSVFSPVATEIKIPFPWIVFTRPGSSPPAVGPPGKFIQGPRRGRQYGPDGKPVYDIDNPHQGYPDPHAHNWSNGVRDEPGYPVSPLPGQPNGTGDDDGG